MTDGQGRERARLPWWPEVRERATTREPLTRDQIVQAAIRIADAEGLDALSMRRLAQDLSVATTSLYWHVRNKDELLDLLIDEVLGEIPIDDDPASPWRERIADLARGLREMMKRHPGAAQLLGSRETSGPNALAGVDRMIGILRAAGFEGTRLTLAYQVVLNYASGWGVMESRGISGQPAGTTRDELVASLGSMLASLPPDLYPNLIAAMGGAAEATEDLQFEYGLRMLLDGMEADLERTRAEGAAAVRPG